MPDDKSKGIKKKMEEMKKLKDQQEKLAKDLMKLTKDDNGMALMMKIMSELVKKQHSTAKNVIKNIR